MNPTLKAHRSHNATPTPTSAASPGVKRCRAISLLLAAAALPFLGGCVTAVPAIALLGTPALVVPSTAALVGVSVGIGALKSSVPTHREVSGELAAPLDASVRAVEKAFSDFRFRSITTVRNEESTQTTARDATGRPAAVDFRPSADGGTTVLIEIGDRDRAQALLTRIQRNLEAEAEAGAVPPAALASAGE